MVLLSSALRRPRRDRAPSRPDAPGVLPQAGVDAGADRDDQILELDAKLVETDARAVEARAARPAAKPRLGLYDAHS